jgi:type I restriction enzyme, S subunit
MAARTKAPSGWSEVTLGDIASEANDRHGDGRERHVYSMTKHRGFVPSSEYFDRQVFSRDLSNYKVVRSGQFAYATIHLDEGAIDLFEFDDGLISPMYTVFEVNTTKIDAQFLKLLLKSESYLLRYGQLGQGTVNRRKSIGFESLAKLRLQMPSLAVQNRIVEVVSGINETIQATRAVLEQTHLLKSALQEQLLAKGIGHTRFRKTKTGQVPTEWKIDTVGNLCEFSSGTGFSHSDWSTRGLPIIRIQNLNGSTDFNYYEGEPDPRWIVEPEELLFAWAGVKGVSFGPCIWPGPRGLLNQHIYRIRPKEGIDSRWLYAILGEVTHRIEAKAHGFKTSLVHVHKADITDQIVAVPPPELRKKTT